MRSGEIWTLRDDVYASKARPVIVVQARELERFDSVILCLLTSYDSTDIPNRVKINPDKDNALTQPSYVMTDKIVTVNKALLGRKIGCLCEAQMAEVRENLAILLGIKINPMLQESCSGKEKR